MLELMLVCALLDVMLEEFGDLNVLRAKSAIRNKLAFFGQVEVIKIFVFEFLAV
jgi:hypothetical protein